MFSLSQKGTITLNFLSNFVASNPDDEFGEISYVDWIKNRNW